MLSTYINNKNKIINNNENHKIQNANTQMIITFSNEIFNKIYNNSIIKDKNGKLLIHNLKILKTLKYPLTVGRKIFNYN